jgi:predicted amidohydrolase
VTTRAAEAPGSGGLRVAAAQAGSVLGDVEANVATAVSLVQRAADGGARVVVLPELFLTGYDPDGWSAQTCTSPQDPRLLPLVEAATRHRIVVLVGAAVPWDSSAVSAQEAPEGLQSHRDQQWALALLLVEPGGVRTVYRKQHLTDEEKAFFTPGDGGASIVVDGWELGLGICFDGCFPEHAAAAAQDGASAYLCPSAYYVGSEHRRDLYYAARALDNGIYVVFAGLTGRCGTKAFNGGSAVYDPEGRPVARVGEDSPALAFADLDPAEVARVQQLNPILRERLVSLGERVTLEIAAGSVR